jgi:hypothetical protein
MNRDERAPRVKQRAALFRYDGLQVFDTSLEAHYELDGRAFTETIAFDGVRGLDHPAAHSIAELWYLIAGLSYYKAGAATCIELGTTALGEHGRALFEAALVDGLGEFAYRNDLSLEDTRIEGGIDVQRRSPSVDSTRVLTPFGGGIDSVVSVTELSSSIDQSLFIVSPLSGRFAPLERTAARSGLPIVRATRVLDPQILADDNEFFNGHVPVTTMVTLLAALAAVASGRGGVVMSNEHSSSEPNVRWRDRDINHQWSKSLIAEDLIANAVRERVGEDVNIASFLRDRSEIWVAQQFAQQPQFHDVFRSCNRAFRQDSARRFEDWCGVCDKCLFVNLMLAPFLSRPALRTIFKSEPLANHELEGQLRTLIGVGLEHKPFECVGDPDECAVALEYVSTLSEWSDVTWLRELALLARSDREFSELLQPLGPTRVPSHWLR